jgi:hypothetical protein
MVLPLLVMSAKVVTCRYRWQRWAPRSRAVVACGRSVRASIINWSCSCWGSIHNLSSCWTVRQQVLLNSHSCDAQHLSMYERTSFPSLLRTLQEVPDCNCKQSSSTLMLLPTRSDFHKWPMRSFFLVEPWIGQNSGTLMPPYNAGADRTSFGVERLIPILDRIVGKSLWQKLHSHAYTRAMVCSFVIFTHYLIYLSRRIAKKIRLWHCLFASFISLSQLIIVIWIKTSVGITTVFHTGISRAVAAA